MTLTNTTVLLSEVLKCYPVLSITGKFQDQLPGKLTTITNRTVAGNFDIVFGRGEKHLTIALL